MLDKNYHYFIAFKHSKGYGNMEVEFPLPIRDIKDINAIQKLIKKDAKEKDGVEIDNVCITNFQLF